MTVPVPIDYTTIMTITLDKLEKSVQDHIKRKWIPLGGVIYANGSFIQAMVKYEE